MILKQGCEEKEFKGCMSEGKTINKEVDSERGRELTGEGNEREEEKGSKMHG